MTKKWANRTPKPKVKRVRKVVMRLETRNDGQPKIRLAMGWVNAKALIGSSRFGSSQGGPPVTLT